MKTFYTERDIVDMHRAGVTEIEISDDVILTALARDKAADLGITLTSVEIAAPPSPPPASPAAGQGSTLSEADIIARVKAGVIAKMGTTAYNDLLDQIIPQVLARLTGVQSGSPRHSAENSGGDGY